MRILPATIVAAIWLFACAHVWAQTDDPFMDRLVNEIQQASESLDPNKVRDPSPLKQQAILSIQELDAFLVNTTSESNRQAWLKYFDFDPMLDAIETDASNSKLRVEARKVHDRLIGFYPGLEFPKVRAVRDAVGELHKSLLFYGIRERIMPGIAKKVSALAETYQEIDGVPSVEDFEATNEVLWLLNNTNQDLPMQKTLRQMFSQTNVKVWVNEPIVQTVAHQRIDQCEPVKDCILGTSISGNACTVGNVNVDLVPADGFVRLRIDMTGHINSRNIGFNKPVRLVTSAQSNFYVTRVLNASESGVSLEPIHAQASLNSSIHSIQHRFRIVRRIAWKKALESKPRADRIAADHLRQRIEEEFATKTQEAVAFTLPDISKKILPFLMRFDFPEPPRFLSSTDTAIQLRSLVARGEQLAAPISPPSIVGSYDGAIQIHESVVNNTVGRFLAGRIVTQRELNKLTEKLGQGRVESVKKDANEDKKNPLKIEFDRYRPVIFEARDGAIRVGIRAVFAQGKRRPKIELSAVYRPVRTVEGFVVLHRDGDLKIDFLSKISQTIKAGMRNTVREKITNPFPEWLLDQPFQIPSDAKIKAVAGRTYRLRSILAEDGWITATLQ